MMEEYEVVILGAGISGLSAFLYLNRAGIKTLIIENNVPGGQLNEISMIENYPGYSRISGVDLIANLLEQVDSYQENFVYGETLNIDYDKKIIKLKSDREIKYDSLVFATGRREKKLGLPKEDDLIGMGISFCASCDGALYKDRDVIVVGGANSAVSEAIYLANICKHVFLIYRKEELRAEDILRKRLDKLNNVTIYYGSSVQEYQEEEGFVKGVILSDGRIIRADGIFLAIGRVPNSELFMGQKDDGYIVVNNYFETSVSDVYACGDVIKKDLYQLITASSDGVMVASRIISKNVR